MLLVRNKKGKAMGVKDILENFCPSTYMKQIMLEEEEEEEDDGDNV
jgi:hypothetical protein